MTNEEQIENLKNLIIERECKIKSLRRELKKTNKGNQRLAHGYLEFYQKDLEPFKTILEKAAQFLVWRTEGPYGPPPEQPTQILKKIRRVFSNLEKKKESINPEHLPIEFKM